MRANRTMIPQISFDNILNLRFIHLKFKIKFDILCFDYRILYELYKG